MAAVAPVNPETQNALDRIRPIDTNDPDAVNSIRQILAGMTRGPDWATPGSPYYDEDVWQESARIVKRRAINSLEALIRLNRGGRKKLSRKRNARSRRGRRDSERASTRRRR